MVLSPQMVLDLRKFFGFIKQLIFPRPRRCKTQKQKLNKNQQSKRR